MPVEDIEYGKFVGKTQADIKALSDRVGKIDSKIEGIEKSLRTLHSKNGWRGAWRPGTIAGGGLGIAHILAEILKRM